MKMLEKVRSKLLRDIVSSPLPRTLPIYCPDPNISFLGYGKRLLQREGLKRGLRIIFDLNAAKGDRLLEAEVADEIVDRCVVYPVCIKSEDIPLALNERNSKVFREADEERVRFRQSVARIQAEINRTGARAILMAQGYGIEAVAARYVAATFGVPTLCLEITARNDRLVWEPISGVTVNRNISHSYFWRHLDFTSFRATERYCREVIERTRSLKREEHASPENRWIPAESRPVIVFIGQVLTDSSVIFGCRSGLDPVSVVLQLARLCRKKNYHLFIKPHPKEINGKAPITFAPYEKLTVRRLREHPEFFDFEKEPWLTLDEENQWDTYGVLEVANLAVTLNSQAGLEAAIRGKPVVTCGRCFYAGLGFTFDVSRPEELGLSVERALQKPLAREDTQLAQSFYYTFFEHYCIPNRIEAILALAKRQARGGHR